MAKYYFYVLRSEQTGEYYKGQTDNIEKRIHRHNRGDSFSTRSGKPWKLVHKEEYQSRSAAIRRERYLKSPDGWKEWLDLKRKIELGLYKKSSALVPKGSPWDLGCPAQKACGILKVAFVLQPSVGHPQTKLVRFCSTLSQFHSCNSLPISGNLRSLVKNNRLISSQNPLRTVV